MGWSFFSVIVAFPRQWSQWRRESRLHCLLYNYFYYVPANKHVYVFLSLFLMVPWVGLWSVIVAFLGHIHSFISWSYSLVLYRGSYMNAHVLLNLLNKMGKKDKTRGLLSILSLFRNEFNKFNNTGAGMLDSIYHMTLRLLWNPISAVKTL